MSINSDKLDMKDAYNKVFGDKNKVLIVLAHPDDMEIICGGLVARLIKDEKEVRSVITTNGEKGMHQADYEINDFAQIRMSSQKQAAMELGVQEDQIFNLGVPDGQLEPTYENIGKIVWHIRDFKPDIIITHNPTEMINTFSSKEGIRWVNHRDHRHTAQLVLDAAYPYSRDRGFFPEHFEEGLTSHDVAQFLFSDSYESPEAVLFEISDFMDVKGKALAHHKDGGVISDDEFETFMDEPKFNAESRGLDGFVEVLGWHQAD